MAMTNQEEQEVIRVCGQDYEETDVPAYIRQQVAAPDEDPAADIDDSPHPSCIRCGRSQALDDTACECGGSPVG